MTSKCIPSCTARDLAVHQLNAVHECKETITARNYLTPTATFTLSGGPTSSSSTVPTAVASGAVISYLAEGDALVTLLGLETAGKENVIVLPSAVPGRTIRFVVAASSTAAANTSFVIVASYGGATHGIITAAPSPAGGSVFHGAASGGGIRIGNANGGQGSLITLTAVRSGNGGTGADALPFWSVEENSGVTAFVSPVTF